MNLSLRFFAGVAWWCALTVMPAFAQPLGPAFTYQGELRTGGVPASGLHDLRFRLYDAQSGGAQIGTTLCAENVSLTSGRFTVQLDFGAQFAGSQRFLEIEVRADTGLGCGVATGFTLLTPRQPLTAAPNAAYALNAGVATTAGSATTATNATQLNGQAASFYQNAANLSTGTIPDARIAGSYSGLLSMTNAGNSFTGSGAGLVGLNASNLGSGTVADARLSGNVALLNAAQTFIAGKTFSGGLLTNAFTLSTGAAAGSVLRSDASGVGTWQAVPPPTGPAGGGLAGTYPNPTIAANAVFSGNLGSDAGSLNRVSGGAMYTNGSFVGIGTTTPIGAAGFVTSQNTGLFGGMYVNTSGATGWPFYGYAQSGGIAAYHYIDGGDGNKWKLINSGALGITVTTGGDVGIGSASPASRLQVDGGGGDALLVTNTGGGRGATINAQTDTAIWANTTSGFAGVDGRSAGTSGTGIFGFATAATGTTFGVRGQSASTDGRGVSGYATDPTGFNFGVWGQSDSTGGTGVYGVASAGIGPAYAVYGQSSSTDGTGVFGFANAPSGSNYGVYGQSYSSSGRGVYGAAWANSGTIYGVHGYASIATSGYGVFASGRSGASGTKSFRIDHPDDPENKYLLHYSTESPEVLNSYSGTIALDSAGQAVVELPRYFAKINKDPRYTLTAVGSPMPMLHVAGKISAESLTRGAAMEPAESAPLCTFRIAGGAPGGEVSWEVKAVRNDRFVQQHGAPVEVEKQNLEKGTYQHPELYGQPPEKGWNHDAALKRPEPIAAVRR